MLGGCGGFPWSGGLGWGSGLLGADTYALGLGGYSTPFFGYPAGIC